MENYSVLMSVYHKERPDWLKISINSMMNQTILTVFCSESAQRLCDDFSFVGSGFVHF